VSIRWVAVAIDCEWAGPMARFYEGLLGFEIRDLGPGGRWAQLFHPDGGLHLNIQGYEGYEPPTWPEVPGRQAKMFHFEIQVDDLEASIALALELGGSEAPWQPPTRNLKRLRVMLDPAGHPFCLFLEGE
jgi:catechol 2,3-dioxygenase-like lactoylglutathione lyase family enzyme